MTTEDFDAPPKTDEAVTQGRQGWSQPDDAPQPGFATSLTPLGPRLGDEVAVDSTPKRSALGEAPLTCKRCATNQGI